MKSKGNKSIPIDKKKSVGRSRSTDKRDKEHVSTSIQFKTEYCPNGARRVLNLLALSPKPNKKPVQVPQDIATDVPKQVAFKTKPKKHAKATKSSYMVPNDAKTTSSSQKTEETKDDPVKITPPIKKKSRITIDLTNDNDISSVIDLINSDDLDNVEYTTVKESTFISINTQHELFFTYDLTGVKSGNILPSGYCVLQAP